MDYSQMKKAQLIEKIEALQRQIAELDRAETERKRVEDAVWASKQLVEKTLYSLRDAVFILDADTVEVRDCNPAASEIFGYSRDEILGRTTAFLHVDEAALEEFRRHLYPAIQEKGFLSQLEFRMKRKDGTIFLTEHSVMSLQDEQGKRIGWVSVVRDLTERKRAEERIRRESARAEVLVRVAARLNAQLDLPTVLNLVCEETAHALNVNAAGVTLYDEKRDGLYLAASFGLAPEYRERHTPFPRALYEEYVRRLGPFLVFPDVHAQPGLPNAELFAQYNIRTVAAVSMIQDTQLVGTLHVYTLSEPRAFSDDELALLKGLADQAALAITNARLHQEVQRHAAELEQRVAERTAELERLVNAMTGREVRMAELKEVIKQLRAQLEAAGLTPAADDPLAAWREKT